VRAFVTVLGGIVAGLGRFVVVLNVVPAVRRSASSTGSLTHSQVALLAGYTLLGAGIGLMVAAVTHKKS
jgi:hypothetical protein